MLAEEYDHFLLDPSDLVVGTAWPRICGSLKALSKSLPDPQHHHLLLGIPFGFAPFSLPEVIDALEAIKKAGQESIRIAHPPGPSRKRQKRWGSDAVRAFTQARSTPSGDFFRGTKEIMLDMYRRPDTLLKACEKLLPIMFEIALNAAKVSGNPRVFIPIHKGLDGFMSIDQFKKFYWPTLRDLMIALINEGLNPCPLWEGDCTSRLEVVKDKSPGKACYAFEATDMVKAKEVLGEKVLHQRECPPFGAHDRNSGRCEAILQETHRPSGKAEGTL